MANNNSSQDSFIGNGASYVRVSTDHQETIRQHASVKNFLKKNNLTISNQFMFEDMGWARDEADRRPNFQRMLRLVKENKIQWIVVDQLDRFGTKDSMQLISYLHQLRESNCKLFDTSGKNWVDQEIATILTAVVEGEKSKGEQKEKSHRVLGGKIEKARLGEYQGGPLRFGFDVVCFSRSTDKELWRVIFDGKDSQGIKRIKCYPDGTEERFDGENNFPKFQEKMEVLRVQPSKDKAKIKAVKTVFHRFATEDISFSTIAHYLNSHGYRNSYGGYFQHSHIESMMEDCIYLGFYTWNKRHSGKFHRYKNGSTHLELNYDERQEKNSKSDWVQSDERLFPPLIDSETWSKVQAKLDKPKKGRKCPNPNYLFASLMYCSRCGGKMVGSPQNKKVAYCCGTYFKSVKQGTKDSPCPRNGVYQHELEPIIEKYLQDAGERLQVLMGAKPIDNSPQKNQALSHWQEFITAMDEIQAYLAQHAPPGAYDELFQDVEEGKIEASDAFLIAFRDCFSPDTISQEKAKLEVEHTQLTQQILNLAPSMKRAIDKANIQLGELESKLTNLEKQEKNLADVAEYHLKQMNAINLAITKAKQVFKAETEPRQRKEAIKQVIHRIELEFEPRIPTGGGPNARQSTLVKVVIHPIVGDSVSYDPSSIGTLLYSSAHSCMYRT